MATKAKIGELVDAVIDDRGPETLPEMAEATNDRGARRE
jgi:hypothetical protein